MFCWELENQKGAIACTRSTAIAPFWFSIEYHWAVGVPSGSHPMTLLVYFQKGLGLLGAGGAAAFPEKKLGEGAFLRTQETIVKCAEKAVILCEDLYRGGGGGGGLSADEQHLRSWKWFLWGEGWKVMNFGMVT